MRLSELWRTTTFRLTILYGAIFAVGLIALLAMIYLQSAVYLTRRVDGILNTQADALARSPPSVLAERIDEALSLDGTQTNVFALFNSKGQWVAGNLKRAPAKPSAGWSTLEIPPTTDFPAYARLLVRPLASGEMLVVGRDINQLREMRSIIASALIVSGAAIIVVVLGLATVLSLPPLHRLRMLQAAGEEIAAGDLKRRMPTSQRRDELDMFATTVNVMMDEVERLMLEVRGVTEAIAHDLRTPLVHARSQLHRLQQSDRQDAAGLSSVIEEIDLVLDRFRSLLRISELEARERHAAFTPTDLGVICEKVVELYRPLAEANGVRLMFAPGQSANVEAEPKLLFEAVSNLVDNAIKFSPQGGAVEVSLSGAPASPCVVVTDNGPGIEESERTAVLQRFYRSERTPPTSGSGLGLSIVTAIMKLHRFELVLQDASPGLRAVIECHKTI